MDSKKYFSTYGAVPVYNPFETDDFYYKNGPHAAFVGPEIHVDFSNPRNLYKKLMVYVEFSSSRTVPMSDSLSIEDLKKEGHTKRFQEAKELFEKNYRLYSSNWTDYEKKKVTAAYSMLQLVEFNHKIFLGSGTVNLDSIDFKIMRDLIKNCIGDETFLLTTGVFMANLLVFKTMGCYNLVKFFLIALKENVKIAQATELVQKNRHVKANPYMTFEEMLLYQEFLDLEIQLLMVKMIFLKSINYLETGEECILAGYDEENAKILMEIFKGKELSDSELVAIPTKIRNYEEAEKTAKLMTKMAQKRVELAQKNLKSVEVISKWMRLAEKHNNRQVHIPTLLKMKEFYAGFVYYATAYFHPSKNVKYKMMKKSIGYLETLMKSRDLTEFPELSPEFSETCMILSDAYADSWHIKYEMYQKKPSKDDWNLIKALASERVRIGNEFQSAMDNKNQKISTMYDLVKCYTLVLKDNATAETKTGELIDFLIENPKFLDFFQKLSGVRVSKLVNKQLLISAIINSTSRNLE